MATQYLVKEIPPEEQHELADHWTFWYLIPKLDYSTTDWSSFLKELLSFKTFEDFWGILNSINRPSTLVTGCRYYIFKKGIRPLWEDEHNSNGFQVTTSYQDRKNGEAMWEKLAALVVGQTVSEYPFINGVEFTCKKSVVTIGVWTKQIDSEQVESIKQSFQRNLQNVGDISVTKIEVSK